MNIVRLCIAAVLSAASASSHRNVSNIRVFPALNQSIAGVIQVSSLNDQNQPQYTFSASEARRFCQSLGLIIASRTEMEQAHRRGLETCRFGWTDESVAVIPRIHARAHCGRNQTGLVTWRTPLSQKFDVFCFNESDAAAQLNNSDCLWEPGQTPTGTSDFPLMTKPTSSSSSPSFSVTTADEIMNEVEPVRFFGSTDNASRVNILLISCTCGLLLICVIIVTYLKLRRGYPQKSDVMQQEEYVHTEDIDCVKNNTETRPEDHRMQVEDDTL